MNKTRPLLFVSTCVAVVFVAIAAQTSVLSVGLTLAAMFNAWAAGLMIGAYPEALPWRI